MRCKGPPTSLDPRRQLTSPQQPLDKGFDRPPPKQAAAEARTARAAEDEEKNDLARGPSQRQDRPAPARDSVRSASQQSETGPGAKPTLRPQHSGARPSQPESTRAPTSPKKRVTHRPKTNGPPKPYPDPPSQPQALPNQPTQALTLHPPFPSPDNTQLPFPKPHSHSPPPTPWKELGRQLHRLVHPQPQGQSPPPELAEHRGLQPRAAKELHGQHKARIPPPICTEPARRPGPPP